jgi:hypothetical protein
MLGKLNTFPTLIFKHNKGKIMLKKDEYDNYLKEQIQSIYITPEEYNSRIKNTANFLNDLILKNRKLLTKFFEFYCDGIFSWKFDSEENVIEPSMIREIKEGAKKGYTAYFLYSNKEDIQQSFIFEVLTSMISALKEDEQTKNDFTNTMMEIHAHSDLKFNAVDKDFFAEAITGVYSGFLPLIDPSKLGGKDLASLKLMPEFIEVFNKYLHLYGLKITELTDGEEVKYIVDYSKWIEERNSKKTIFYMESPKVESLTLPEIWKQNKTPLL